MSFDVVVFNHKLFNHFNKILIEKHFYATHIYLKMFESSGFRIYYDILATVLSLLMASFEHLNYPFNRQPMFVKDSMPKSNFSSNYSFKKREVLFELYNFLTLTTSKGVIKDNKLKEQGEGLF